MRFIFVCISLLCFFFFVLSMPCSGCLALGEVTPIFLNLLKQIVFWSLMNYSPDVYEESMCKITFSNYNTFQNFSKPI